VLYDTYSATAVWFAQLKYFVIFIIFAKEFMYLLHFLGLSVCLSASGITLKVVVAIFFEGIRSLDKK